MIADVDETHIRGPGPLLPASESIRKAREAIDRGRETTKPRGPQKIAPRPRTDRPSVVPSYDQVYGPIDETPPAEELGEADEPDDDDVFASNEPEEYVE